MVRNVIGSESGDIVLRHVIKILLVVAIVIFLLTELGPILWFKFSTLNEAEDVANATAFEYKTTNSIENALQVASEKMSMMDYSEEEIRNSVVQFLPEGNVPKEKVRVTVVRYANTLFTRHIAPLKRFSKISTTREANVQEALAPK